MKSYNEARQKQYYGIDQTQNMVLATLDHTIQVLLLGNYDAQTLFGVISSIKQAQETIKEQSEIISELKRGKE